jgi:hypothetical protein
MPKLQIPLMLWRRAFDNTPFNQPNSISPIQSAHIDRLLQKSKTRSDASRRDDLYLLTFDAKKTSRMTH